MKMSLCFVFGVIVFCLFLPQSGMAQASSKEIAEIIRLGHKAEREQNPKKLMMAAKRLKQSGAQPYENEPDLALIWAEKAQKLGAQPLAEHEFRGRVLGPAYRKGVIEAGGEFSTRQSFLSGQIADISVQALAGGRLSLGVYDEEGTPMCRVSQSPKALGCRFVPVVTSIMSIHIDNPQTRLVQFYLVMN